MSDAVRIEKETTLYVRFNGDVIRTPQTWRVHFIVRALPLPTSTLPIPDWLSIQKVDEWNARISVQVTVPSINENPLPIAEERLLNFLSIYNIIYGLHAKIERFDGANERVVEGAKEEIVTDDGSGRFALGAITMAVTYVWPVIPEEIRLKSLENAIMLFGANETSLIDPTHLFLRLAIKYYNLGKFSRDLEQTVLDWIVALEALFSDSEGELQHKLSLRVAWMLGRDGKDRTEIAKRVRSLYGIRSDIVHGRTFKIVDEDIRTLEIYVRKSIFKILEREDRPSKDTILQELHEKLLGAT
jgi:hypothetical protein